MLYCQQTSPYLIKRNGNYEDNDQYEGYCAELAKHIAAKLNLTYVIKPVADGKYGSQNEDGTWDGMVGELLSSVSHSHHEVHCVQVLST